MAKRAKHPIRRALGILIVFLMAVFIAVMVFVPSGEEETLKTICTTEEITLTK